MTPVKVLAALLSLAAVAVLHAPAAWAASALDLRYDGYALGFPALSLKFRVEETERDYRIRGEAHTNGLADWMLRFEMEGESGGSLLDGRPEPVSYRTHTTRHSEQRHAELDYSSRPIRATVSPPPLPEDPEILAADTAGTVDPLTAILGAGRHLAATGSCALRIKVFDGRRRYDLLVTDEGDEELVRGLGSFAGRARHCVVETIRLKGPAFDAKSADPSAPKKPPAHLWLAVPWPGATPLPVRLDFHSNWGSTSIRLEAVTPAEARPEAAAAQ